MNKLETKIFNTIASSGKYCYSDEATEKAKEQHAVENLANNGYISIKIKTLYYCVAEIL